jgi:uncharacterized membrane protein YjfL (UPF0719 family)
MKPYQLFNQHAYNSISFIIVTAIPVAVPSEFFTSVLLWFIRAFISSIICLAIGIIAIKSLTHITTKISEFQTIKGNPVATGLFVSGFLVYAGLVVYGSMVNPFFLGQSVLIGPYFNLQRLLVVALSFFVSLFFGWLFYVIFAKLTPFGVDLDDVNKSPIAIGIYLFGYEVFLGLIVYGSLMIPLG